MNDARPALRVDRVRLANARAGDRARLASALAMASPASTGVGERALLLIRRVRVARPLGAGFEGFVGELIDCIRAAKTGARRGAIGSGESLYFEDEIALECAIVAAVIDNAPLPEMVRQAIPGSATPMLRWRRRILSDDRKLPRVIASLVEAGSAGIWLARFEPGELRAAADLLMRAYGGSSPWRESTPGSRGAVSPTPPPQRAVRRIVAIDEALAAARAVTAGDAARALIAIALLAARRPALVATAAFAEALAMAPATAEQAPAPRLGTPIPDLAPPPIEEITPPTASRPKPTGSRVSELPSPIAARAVSPPPVALAAPQQRATKRRAFVPSLTSQEGAPPLDSTVTARVTSDHAGLFFLLNIFLALGLYGDFTDPVRRVRGLSPFELLLLLARRWIGAGFDRDPLASVLRALAGLGPRARPGHGFEAPAWEVPTDWCAPWPPSSAREVRSRYGTSLWHRAGFPLADRWQDEPPPTWLRRRWVTCLALYIEARLARALDIDDRAEAIATLVRRRGTLRVEDGGIEVAFDLDGHPLSIRLAGLDRDPGWIPAAGHAIGFRFT